MACEGGKGLWVFIYSNKLAYLQLMYLVYGSNPPKYHEQGYLLQGYKVTWKFVQRTSPLYVCSNSK